MMPTETSVRLSAEMTGYSGYNTDTYLNPSELNLWRVIRKNDDGTVDMVSEYVSSKGVFFLNAVGYKNYVRYLNELASKYTNNDYIIQARYVGYNGQTGIIKDTSRFDGTSNDVPWIFSTGYSCIGKKDESLGSGDSLYNTDYNLIKNAYVGKSWNGTIYPSGTTIGHIVTTKAATTYWIASRLYVYVNSDAYYFAARSINPDGNVGNLSLYGRQSDGSWSNGGLYWRYLRPIVTLKYDAVDDGIGLYKMPLYYEFGNPTTSSTTDYSTLKYTDANEVEQQRNVFIGLYEDGSKGICGIKNNNIECFKNSNFEIEKLHVQNFFSSNGDNCDIQNNYIRCFQNGVLRVFLSEYGDISITDTVSTCGMNSQNIISCD